MSWHQVARTAWYLASNEALLENEDEAGRKAKEAREALQRRLEQAQQPQFPKMQRKAAGRR